MYKTTCQFEYLLSKDGLAYRPCYSKKNETSNTIVGYQ